MIDELIKLAHAVAAFEELQTVLNIYLGKTKNLTILRDDIWIVFKNGNELFSSPSYTSCAEFALNYTEEPKSE